MNNYLADIMTQLFGHGVLDSDPADVGAAGQDYSSTGGYSPTELVRLGLLHPGTLSNQNRFLGGIRPGTRPTNTERLPAGSTLPSQIDTGPNPDPAPAPSADDNKKIIDIIDTIFPPQPAPSPKPAPAPSPKPKPPLGRPVTPPNLYGAGHSGNSSGGTSVSGGGTTTYNPYGASRH